MFYPGDKTMEGGVINHGYVGDAPTRGNNNRPARFPSSSDSTSGYHSAGSCTLDVKLIKFYFII